MLALYPIIVILLCDVAVIMASIFWVEHDGERAYNPIRAWQPYLVRMAVYCVFAYFAMNDGDESGLVNTCGWYAILITSVCHAFYAILQTMHLKDPSWLMGTNGSVGIPNWISIMRIALSLLVPHLYAAQPFGEVSCTIGTIILVVAMLSDAVDGFFARKLKAFTKAGKALDPLGDKVIFYPVVIAFIIATNGTAYLTNNTYRIIFYVSLGLMTLRDVLFIIWFALYYKKLPEGIGACLVDKIRMVAICIFLGLMALTLTLPRLKFDLAVIGLADLVAVAILSIISLIVDYGRVEHLIKNS
jgi:phosphatidylglycerophosphate synthase